MRCRFIAAGRWERMEEVPSYSSRVDDLPAVWRTIDAPTGPDVFSRRADETIDMTAREHVFERREWRHGDGRVEHIFVEHGLPGDAITPHECADLVRLRAEVRTLQQLCAGAAALIDDHRLLPMLEDNAARYGRAGDAMRLGRLVDGLRAVVQRLTPAAREAWYR